MTSRNGSAARKTVDRAKGRLMDEHDDDGAGSLALPPAAGDDRTGCRSARSRNGSSTARSRPEAVAPRAYHPRHGADDRDVAPKLLLIDGLSLAFRAFYALPTDLATPDGTVTNAVYGFTSMLVKVLTDEQPDEIVVVFDAPGRTFRDDLDAEYKAGRKETPDLFVPQIPLIHEVIEALQHPHAAVEGVEADDVIATLATRAAAAGIDVVVVTGDRDAYQLVEDPHVKVLYNRRGVSDYVLYDEAGIFERTGVTPSQYPEYAALRGDPSDNLPGVPGIGEKTAAKLVTTYGEPRGDLRAPRRAAPEAAPEPRRDARPGVPEPRDVAAASATCRSTSSPASSARARGTASRCACSSTSSRSARCCPRLLDGLGETSAAGSKRVRDARRRGRRVARRRGGARALRRAHATRTSRTRSSRAGTARRSRARSRAIGLAHGEHAAYLDAELLRDPAVHDALAALVSAPAGRRWSRTGRRS